MRRLYEGASYTCAMSLTFPHAPAELRAAALAALALSDPEHKLAAVAHLADARLPVDPGLALTADVELPGRPARPKLVPATAVPQRSVHTREGHAALLHAIAHIEFNAIALALDAIWRFGGMPAEYYADWLKVAREEAHHFSLLSRHLQTLGFAYGDFLAHNGLWEMAEKTRDDVLARMALVPRTLEARGLDASPAVRAKLAAIGDAEGAAILDIILRDEIGHVAIGNRWYGHLCALRGLEPVATYAQLAQRYGAPRPRAPFNLVARRAAGFTEDELAALGDG